MDNEGYIPVTPAILSLALALQFAAEAYRAESILARNLKLPEPYDYLHRCEILFGQYAKSMAADGILQNRVTFRTMMEAAPPKEMLEVPYPELPRKWQFNPLRGWRRVQVQLSDVLFDRLAACTDVNDHGEAYFAAAMALGLPALVATFERINREQLRLGCLSHDLLVERRGAYDRLLSEAKSLISEDQYRRLYMCF